MVRDGLAPDTLDPAVREWVAPDLTAGTRRAVSIPETLFHLKPRATLVYLAPSASCARHRCLPWLRFRRRTERCRSRGWGKRRSPASWVTAHGRGRYRSGQTGQTVNLLLHSFGGSNPSLPR